jgi:hypothetical protein
MHLVTEANLALEAIRATSAVRDPVALAAVAHLDARSLARYRDQSRHPGDRVRMPGLHVV